MSFCAGLSQLFQCVVLFCSTVFIALRRFIFVNFCRTVNLCIGLIIALLVVTATWVQRLVVFTRLEPGGLAEPPCKDRLPGCPLKRYGLKWGSPTSCGAFCVIVCSPIPSMLFPFLCVYHISIAIHLYRKFTKARKAIKIFSFCQEKKHVPHHAIRTLPHCMCIYKCIHTTQWLDKAHFQISDKSGQVVFRVDVPEKTASM